MSSLRPSTANTAVNNDQIKNAKLQNQLDMKRRQMTERGGVIASNSTPLAAPKLIIPKVQTVQVEDISSETLDEAYYSPANSVSSPPALVSPIPTVQVISNNSKLNSPNFISVASNSLRPKTPSEPNHDRTTSVSSVANNSDSSDNEQYFNQSKEKEMSPSRSRANVNSPNTHKNSELKRPDSSSSLEKGIPTKDSPKIRQATKDQNSRKHRKSIETTAGVQAQNLPSFLASILDPGADFTQPSIKGNEKYKESVKLGGLIPGKSLKEFAMIPCPIGYKYQCKILRNKDSDRYEMYLEEPDGRENFILAAFKQKKSSGSNYIVSSVKDQPRSRDETVGKVSSNFMGTQFVVYDNGYNPFKNKIKPVNDETARREVCLVNYESSILGLSGPRKMTFIIPKMLKSGEAAVVQPRHNNETIAEKIKQGLTGDLLQLQNKQPQWNEESNAFVLNFNGRVTVPSVKNFQVVHPSDIDYIIMQFGRTQENAFTLDMQYPMSPYQAFSIAISSLDIKIGCE